MSKKYWVLTLKITVWKKKLKKKTDPGYKDFLPKIVEIFTGHYS